CRPDAELLALLGRCREATGQYREARKCYECAVRADPREIDPALRLASLLLRHAPEVKDKKEDVVPVADAVMNRMVEKNSRSFKVVRGGAHDHEEFAPGGGGEAAARKRAADIRRALALAPNDVEVLLAAADLAREGSEDARAREYLRRAAQRYPQDWRVYQA